LEVYRCQKLIEKYGEDYERMKWDKALNPFQLSPGQLRKLIKKYQENHA
jgi:nucleolar protein 16